MSKKMVVTLSDYMEVDLQIMSEFTSMPPSNIIGRELMKLFEKMYRNDEEFREFADKRAKELR